MGAHALGDSERHPSSNRVAFALAVLFTLGAASVFIAGALHAGPVVWADACGYLSAAQVVAERHQYGHSLIQLNVLMLPDPPEIDRVGWWPPGYPVAIALASGMRADDPARMIAAAHALDLISQLLAAAGFGVLAGIASRNRTAGVLTAGLYLLSVPIIHEIPRLQSEHLYMPLLAWALVLHLSAARKPRAATIAGAAVLWALAGLTRHVAIVAAGCAGLAVIASAWRERDRWRRIGVGLIPTFACWAGAAAWVARNTAVAGRARDHLEPGPDPYVPQIFETVWAYLLGLSGPPLAPSALPRMRDMIVLAGGGLLTVALITLIVVTMQRRREQRDPAWHWLAVFAATFIPLTLAMLVYASVNQRINTLFGRYVSPTTAITVVLLIAGAAQLRTLRAPVVLLAICIAAGGLLQGVTNLLLPNAWEKMADLRELHDSPAVREAVRGQALLLTARDGPRPAVDLVPAAVFLPEARTIYWLDNPQYSGVTLTGDDIARLAREGTFSLILRGPEQRLVAEWGHEESRLALLRRGISEALIDEQLAEIDYLREFTVHPPWETEVVARAGEWTIERVVPQ